MKVGEEKVRLKKTQKRNGSRKLRDRKKKESCIYVSVTTKSCKKLVFFVAEERGGGRSSVTLDFSKRKKQNTFMHHYSYLFAPLFVPIFT